MYAHTLQNYLSGLRWTMEFAVKKSRVGQTYGPEKNLS